MPWPRRARHRRRGRRADPSRPRAGTTAPRGQGPLGAAAPPPADPDHPDRRRLATARSAEPATPTAFTRARRREPVRHGPGGEEAVAKKAVATKAVAKKAIAKKAVASTTADPIPTGSSGGAAATQPAEPLRPAKKTPTRKRQPVAGVTRLRVPERVVTAPRPPPLRPRPVRRPSALAARARHRLDPGSLPRPTTTSTRYDTRPSTLLYRRWRTPPGCPRRTRSPSMRRPTRPCGRPSPALTSPESADPSRGAENR